MLARFVLMFGLVAVALFGGAGRFDLPFFWGYLAVLIGGSAIVASIIDPDLRRERLDPGAGQDQRLPALLRVMFLAHLLLAGLDAGRFGWSPALPRAVQVAGLALMAASIAFSGWAMRVNRFFSPVVRLQTERGHRVVDTGPYRFIRHPGYLSSVGLFGGGVTALGSLWAATALVPLFVLMLRRVRMEDAFLHDNLPGYRQYASRVRWRLVPGVW